MRSMMSQFLITVFDLMVMGALAVLGHLAVIEIDREVVTLKTRSANGRLQKTRLWIVNDGDIAWLHSGEKDWAARFTGNPVVEIHRTGQCQHSGRATGTAGDWHRKVKLNVGPGCPVRSNHDGIRCAVC